MAGPEQHVQDAHQRSFEVRRDGVPDFDEGGSIPDAFLP
jgi:hypothetical protein